MIFLLTFEKIQPRELDASCQWFPGQSRQYIILRVQKTNLKKDRYNEHLLWGVGYVKTLFFIKVTVDGVNRQSQNKKISKVFLQY